MIWIDCLQLFYIFVKIGALGFGGGYAMLSMIMAESRQLGITLQQFADLNALDMIVPGPIAINAATYVGYLNSGFWGSLFATLGVMLPSFIFTIVVMKFLTHFSDRPFTKGFLSGVKPAAVGLIAAASVTIASGVLLQQGASISSFFVNPLGTISIFSVAVFVITAVAVIKYRANPIVLTVIAGIVGAILCR